MTQNIYDDPKFFAGYSTLPRSRHGLQGAPEWPSLQALLPALEGLRVLDLGCGYGWFGRYAAEQGAKSVRGIDVSSRMIEQATAMTTQPQITYQQADLETIELPSNAYDLVYSSLVAGGSFVFSVEHPIYMASRNPGFRTDEEGQRFWPIDSYQSEGSRTTNWFADGVIKQHRTIGTTINMLLGSGFTLRHLEEWGPTAEQVKEHPDLAEECERPMMMLVAASRD